MKILSKNKRAFFDYEILEKIEAGLVLSGQEAKSAKTGGLNLQGSYAKILGNELFLVNAYIKPYAFAGTLRDYEPTRTRKLLVHRSEIIKFLSKSKSSGVNLIPLEGYVKKSRVKILLGLGRSKKKQDKRETIKKRDIEREIKRKIGK